MQVQLLKACEGGLDLLGELRMEDGLDRHVVPQDMNTVLD